MTKRGDTGGEKLIHISHLPKIYWFAKNVFNIKQG